MLSAAIEDGGFSDVPTSTIHVTRVLHLQGPFGKTPGFHSNYQVLGEGKVNIYVNVIGFNRCRNWKKY